MTTTNDILNQFHTIVGDETDLSSFEELELLNKVYNEILNTKKWEILKKEDTGTLTGTEINTPDDFTRLLDEPVIYLGENNKVFRVIPFSERRIYKGQNNIVYYDARQSKFVFLKEQDDTYSYDYIYQPDAITDSVIPVFPSRFWGLFPFFMASDNDFIQLMDKNRSYAEENRLRGEMILNDMMAWNDDLTMMRIYGN